METKLTVYYDDPFWVGVFERIEDGKLSVCKVTFGAEPKDYEVWEFVLQHYYELEFSPAVETGIKRSADNPKRRQIFRILLLRTRKAKAFLPFRSKTSLIAITGCICKRT